MVGCGCVFGYDDVWLLFVEKIVDGCLGLLVLNVCVLFVWVLLLFS